jgi:CheY-like chemotaxis protein
MDRSILIVDDDPAFRELAGRILVDLGLRVTARADTAAAAMAMATDTRPDAALVDIDRQARRAAVEPPRRPHLGRSRCRGA